MNGNDYLVVKTNGNNNQGINTDRIGSHTQTTINNMIHFDGFDKDFYGYHEGRTLLLMKHMMLVVYLSCYNGPYI